MPLLSQLILVIVGLATLAATLIASMAISDFTEGDGGALFFGLVLFVGVGGLVLPFVTKELLTETLGPVDIDWFKSFFFAQLILEPIVYFVGYLWVVCFNTALKAV